MDITIAIVAAVSGYLFGAISFARVIKRLVAPDHDISKVVMEVPGSDTRLESNVISASTIRMHLGPRYGCAVSILDMLKAAVPALVFRLWQPDYPYYLIAATFAVIGHNWPIYYRFVGGRGLSPVLGGMFVVDWLGVLVTNLIGFVIGTPIKNSLIVFGAGIVLMIPWTWIRTGDPAQVLYMVVMNILFWAAMIPELKEYARLIREGRLEEFRDTEMIRIVGRRGDETVENMTVATLWRDLKARFKRDSSTTTPN